MPMKNPPHPGDLIRTEIRATLSALLHGKAALTPEMALRIEKAFGPDMNHLLRMQLASMSRRPAPIPATSASKGMWRRKAAKAPTNRYMVSLYHNPLNIAINPLYFPHP